MNRKRSFLGALSLLVLMPVPCPASCPPPAPVGGAVFPACVMLLPGPSDAHANALTAAYQPFTLLLLTVAGAPLPLTDVTLDFSGIPDLIPSDLQAAGTTVVCAAGIATVTRETNAAGSVTFLVRGAGRNSLVAGGIGPGAFGTVAVSACGVPLGFVNAVTPDENGAGLAGVVVNGIDPSDRSFWLYDLFNYPLTAGRSDLNCSGMVNPPDGSALLDYIFNDPTSAAPQVTTYCP